MTPIASSFFQRLRLACVLTVIGAVGCGCQAVPSPAPNSAYIGRWDLTTIESDGLSSAWLEIEPGDQGRLRGRFVWLFGGAEPVSPIEVGQEGLTFQHHFMGERLMVSAALDGDTLRGATMSGKSSVRWIGVRAPALRSIAPPDWGNPITIFNAHDLSGWDFRTADGHSCWKVQDETLSNERSCSDLITKARFGDFQLQLEFKLNGSGGSGVYLRGRYEVQIADDAGQLPSPRTTGAIYGHLSPAVSAAKPQGEWQTLNVTLVGRQVTVQVNGKTVIADEEIPGITGAALDSHEELPGPIVLQGDHGRISFRNIVLTPAK